MAQVTQAQADLHVAAGLANRERGPRPNLAGLGDLLTFEKLNALAMDAGRRAVRLTELHQGVAAELAKFDSDAVPKLEQQLRGMPLSEAQRNEQVRRAKQAERARVLAIQGPAAERAENIRALREAKEKALAVRALWANPVSVLVRQFANTAGAASWREASRSWGPNQLRDSIDAAIATGDHALLCVCFERLDTMAPEDRKHVDRPKNDAVAQMPIAIASAKATMACDAIALVHDRADMARRETEGEKIASGEKIDIGARAKLLAPFFTDPEQQPQE